MQTIATVGAVASVFDFAFACFAANGVRVSSIFYPHERCSAGLLQDVAGLKHGQTWCGDSFAPTASAGAALVLFVVPADDASAAWENEGVACANQSVALIEGARLSYTPRLQSQTMKLSCPQNRLLVETERRLQNLPSRVSASLLVVFVFVVAPVAAAPAKTAHECSYCYVHLHSDSLS